MYGLLLAKPENTLSVTDTNIRVYEQVKQDAVTPVRRFGLYFVVYEFLNYLGAFPAWRECARHCRSNLKPVASASGKKLVDLREVDVSRVQCLSDNHPGYRQLAKRLDVIQ